jgi:hypothetical protein
MLLAIGLAALTALATALGGLLALRSRDRLHLVLGLAAGLLLGLVAFELLPEVFTEDTGEIFHVPGAALALIGGFFALHLLEAMNPQNLITAMIINTASMQLAPLVRWQWVAMSLSMALPLASHFKSLMSWA